MDPRVPLSVCWLDGFVVFPNFLNTTISPIWTLFSYVKHFDKLGLLLYVHLYNREKIHFFKYLQKLGIQPIFNLEWLHLWILNSFSFFVHLDCIGLVCSKKSNSSSSRLTNIEASLSFANKLLQKTTTTQ